MNKEEYYKRIEKINNRFRTDRVSADEEYQLVCQRNYLSTKYIENLEQQCKKQKEIIDKAIDFIKNFVKKLYFENKQLKDNWNDLKKYVSAEWYCYDNDSVEFEVAKDILNKMQEMEKNYGNVEDNT